MLINFAAALKLLGPDAVFRLIREARPTSDYYLTQFLPEILRPTYHVESGSMKIHATMAGLTGMDSKYPETGVISASKFLEKSAKIANQATLTEQALRELQEFMMRLSAQGGNVNAPKTLAVEALNFFEKVIMQPHWDTMEYLKGQLFTTGEIDWNFNGMSVKIDYGIPSGNKLATRSGNDAYGGSASKFWDDVRLIQKKLKHSVQAYTCHPDTFDVILDNKQNGIKIVEKTENKYGNEYVITRYEAINGVNVESSDSRDTIRVRTYGAEGELINPADPKTTITVPFLSGGKLVGIGSPTTRGYIPGEGASDDESRDRALGYTHVAPTVEGNGQPGRWGRLYTPENMPMQLVGQGVTNGLPVLEGPEKVVIATTDMP